MRDLLCVTVSSLAIVACGNDASIAPSTDPHLLLRRVALRDHAYNLTHTAPYDTVQLYVTTTLADGTTASLPLQYSTSDSAITVDSSGLLHVHGLLANSPERPDLTLTGSRVAKIYVSATLRGVTRRDTAMVIVTDAPTFPTRFVLTHTDQYGESIDVPYSRTWPNVLGDEGINLPWTVLDATGTHIGGLLVDGNSRDTSIAQAGALNAATGNLSIRASGDTGRTWITLSTYAYGRSIRDSVPFSVELPHFYVVTTEVITRANNGIQTELQFGPDSLTVPSGSDISWRSPQGCDSTASYPENPTCHGVWIDVTFDDSIAQYALASRVPAAYGTTPDVHQNIYGDFSLLQLVQGFLRMAYNQRGGAGSIPSFGNVSPDTRTVPCSDVIPITCRKNGGEARLFVRPGHYHYHSAQGAKGVIVVQ